MTEREQELNNLVVKSNKLIQESSFTLTSEQQKVILYVISKIQLTDSDFKEYEIPIAEFIHLMGTTRSGNAYTQIKKDLKALSDKSLWLEDENQAVLVRWLAHAKIDYKKGVALVQLDEYLKPYLIQLKQNFTAYSLLYTLKLKSKYSIRAYEYFCSVHYNPLEPYFLKISVDELKKRLGAETYTQYKDFNTRVLKPITKEINGYTDKKITVEPIKENRKITRLNILIETKDIQERAKVRLKIDSELNGNQISMYRFLEEISSNDNI